jgi:hypothetical protein
MKLVFIPLLILLVVFAADVQGQTRRSDTISVKFSMCETIRGDTVMFKSPTTYEGLKRFFQRNLRYPLDSMHTILCRLFFIINKEGVIADAWCAPGLPDAVAKEVVRVARKMGTLRPGFVRGKPVVTRVETRILFYYEDGTEADNYENYEKDILIVIWRCSIPARPKPLGDDDEQ